MIFETLRHFLFLPSKDLNIILGQNGSGKTSLLEAIYFLSNGKSFRTNKYKLMIRNEQEKCVVHGKKQLHNLSIPVGISKSQSGETQLRIQGQAQSKDCRTRTNTSRAGHYA